MSNSGTEIFKPADKITDEEYDKVFKSVVLFFREPTRTVLGPRRTMLTLSTSLNTRAQLFVAQQGFIHMKRGGKITLMSSVASTMSGVSNHALYAGSKAAAEGFTRSFSKGNTVNAIASEGVKTGMFDE